ncbi:MAG: pilus assembly protein N-terminal domain-containing protein [Pirellulaceae bacterium]
MFQIRNDAIRGCSQIGLALLGAAMAISALATNPAKANPDELIVKYDQSQIIKLPRPVAEIIIGNPMIADVAIQSSNLLVITGKSFGVTNIIALDADRNVIQDQRVMVQRENARVVYLRKGLKRETYNCLPQCNPTVTVGDDTAFFSAVANDSQRKIKLIEGQTDGGSLGGGGN